MCDACGSEVVDFVEQALESGAGGDDKMASFNSQTAWIQEGLRKTAEIVFPQCVGPFPLSPASVAHLSSPPSASTSSSGSQPTRPKEKPTRLRRLCASMCA